MESGCLRHKIELQSCQTVQDDYGEQAKLWTTYDTIWAQIQPLRGHEALLAQQVKAEITHRITIRYNSNVKVTDRVKFNGRIFDINSVRNIGERNVQMELMCKEAV